MSCPHCQSRSVHRRRQRTTLGYRRFWCPSCRRRFNERTGTPFNELQHPTDVVLLAVRRFLRRLMALTEARPRRVTTDLHPAYPNAIRWIVGRKATHRTTQYLNNYTEQSHRAVKQRYYPMLGLLMSPRVV